jgi:hypothetical protein
MKIEVKGNTNFCLENPEPKFKSYFISGDWGLNFSENKIKWILDDNLLGFIQGDSFYKMCEEIQGCEYSDINQIFNIYKINLPNYELSIQEIDLIKSVANIFIWVQYFLIDEYDIENDDSLPKVFDDFKIDNNNKITVQKDIYFLPKKYLEEEYRNLINNLMNINLLSYFKVSSKNTSLENYFIPFTKPGFKLNVFQDKETYEFWKTILYDRHIALDNFFNKR